MAAAVRVCDLLLEPDNEDTATAVGDHLHGRVVQPAQRFAGDHLRRSAGGDAATSDVDHLDNDRDDRVDVVGDHDRADVALPGESADQVRDRHLVGNIET